MNLMRVPLDHDILKQRQSLRSSGEECGNQDQEENGDEKAGCYLIRARTGGEQRKS